MKRLVLFTSLLLVSCTNQNILEVRFTTTGSGAPSYDVKMVSPDKVTTGPVDEVTEPKFNCDKFIMPKLEALPPIPPEVLTKSKISDQELLDILLDHITKLRTGMIKEQYNISEAYRNYIAKCQK